jgi:HD-like signal output (HDOD) protein
MKKWIARWFGGSGDAATAQPDAPAPVSATQPAPGRAPAAPAAPDPDLAFYHWLAGPARADVPATTEQLILDELTRLARQPQAAADLVPRVPAVIPQLLRSLRDDSVSAADLARQVAQDVVLVAEVIREANSPWYRPSTPVRTIEGALMLLGQNGLRMLLARVAFRPVINMQPGRFARQVAPHVWSHSEKCALAASLVAPHHGADPFEAYLSGLMQNVGLVVAFRLIDQVHGHALPQSAPFCHALLAGARTLSGRIAGAWEFPQSASQAIIQAGHPDAPPLAHALAEADRLAKLRVLLDAGIPGFDPAYVSAGLDTRLARHFDKLRNQEN